MNVKNTSRTSHEVREKTTLTGSDGRTAVFIPSIHVREVSLPGGVALPLRSGGTRAGAQNSLERP